VWFCHDPIPFLWGRGANAVAVMWNFWVVIFHVEKPTGLVARFANSHQQSLERQDCLLGMRASTC
jgi:hypothetical protein